MKKLLLLLCPFFASAQQTIGLFQNDSAAFDGYTLFSPITYTTTYLIDNCGRLVHSWPSTHRPGQSVYLLPDGKLFRTTSIASTYFNAGGAGGGVEVLDWNGNVTWSYVFSDSAHRQHHDALMLPNGHALLIAWELHQVADAVSNGRNPALLSGSMWSEQLIEVDTNTSSIVWSWHVWDHLVQHFDSTQANYGVIADHPELVNLNYTTQPSNFDDWLHMNALDYNPQFDQILVSIHNFSEFWIIDHSTTEAQAASHSGGTFGHGGDLLYRWGNPQTYGRGIAADQKFFGQHNVQWIDAGLPDAGKILVFNNGLNRPAGNYTSIEKLDPAVDGSGNYTSPGTLAYSPSATSWIYTANPPNSFFANIISGAQQLPNGNIVFCNGPAGEFWEIGTNDSFVWHYINPVNSTGTNTQGTVVSNNGTFRCTRYATTYSGLAGQTLTPGAEIELNPLPFNCTIYPETGVDEAAVLPSFEIFPNPAQTSCVIRCASLETAVRTQMEIMDLFGRLMLAQNAERTTQIDIRSLPAGIYFVRIGGAVRKLVIE